MTKTDRDTLKALVRRNSLADVLDTLGSICDAQAAHIRTTQDDASTADDWDEASHAIGTAWAQAQTLGLHK